MDELKRSTDFVNNIGVKLFFIFTFLGLVVLSGNVIVSYLHSLHSINGAVINIAGRDRMLSQRIAYYAERVVRGNEEDKMVLASVIDLHHRSFYVLKEGGVAPGMSTEEPVPPTSGNALPILFDAEDLWLEYKEHAEVIANEETYIDGELNPRVHEALSFLEDKSTEMLRRNDLMVSAYVAMDTQQHHRAQIVAAVVAVVAVLSLLVVGYIVNLLVKSARQNQLKLIAQSEDLLSANKVVEESLKEAEQAVKEAQKAKEGLAELNQALVDRELKMVELKEKLESKE